jgi:hypothetical protein
MAAYHHATTETYHTISHWDEVDREVPVEELAPIKPDNHVYNDGHEWRLVASCATSTRVLWFWERRVGG